MNLFVYVTNKEQFINISWLVAVSQRGGPGFISAQYIWDLRWTEYFVSPLWVSIHQWFISINWYITDTIQSWQLIESSSNPFKTVCYCALQNLQLLVNVLQYLRLRFVLFLFLRQIKYWITECTRICNEPQADATVRSTEGSTSNSRSLCNNCNEIYSWTLCPLRETLASRFYWKCTLWTWKF
jgi:hypothetical protein